MVRRRYRVWILGLAFALGFATPHPVVAHPGGLNAEGCHNDRKRGGYHCHGAPSAGAGRTRPSALLNSGGAFPNCSAARAAGAAPIRRGERGYSAHLDRDGDGVACETGGGGARRPSGLDLRDGAAALGVMSAPSIWDGSSATARPRPPKPDPTDDALDGFGVQERAAIVRRLQTRLTQEGYAPGPADGLMGAQMRRALARFQTDLDLPSTGTINGPTLTALGMAGEDEPGDAEFVATGETLTQPIWLERPSALQIARLYPDQAQRAGTEGDVVVECLIAASGALHACEVVSESPEGHGFGAAAARLSRHYRVKAAPHQIGARVLLPIAFRLPS